MAGVAASDASSRFVTAIRAPVGAAHAVEPPGASQPGIVQEPAPATSLRGLAALCECYAAIVAAEAACDAGDQALARVRLRRAAA